MHVLCALVLANVKQLLTIVNNEIQEDFGWILVDFGGFWEDFGRFGWILADFGGFWWILGGFW